MLDEAQIRAFALADDHPVRADLDPAVAGFQILGEQDRHPRHMQDMALVRGRLPMRQIEPGEIDQRRPRGHEALALGMDGDQRDAGQAGAALADSAPGLFGPLAGLAPDLVATGSEHPDLVDHPLAPGAVGLDHPLADPHPIQASLAVAPTDQIAGLNMHQIGPVTARPLLGQVGAGRADGMIDQDVRQAIAQRGGQYIAGEDGQVASGPIDIADQGPNPGVGVVGERHRFAERLAGKGLQAAAKAVKQHRAGQPDAIGLQTFARLARQPGFAGRPHGAGSAEQIMYQRPISGHRHIGGVRGGDILGHRENSSIID